MLPAPHPRSIPRTLGAACLVLVLALVLAAPAGALTTTVTVTHHAASKPSDATIALAALGVLLLLGCIVWACARLVAYEPRWTLSLRHSVAEAGFRASATWAEFSDWARLGR